MPDGFDSLFWVGQNYRVRHVLRLVRHVGYRAGGIGLAKRSHERPHEPEMNSETRDQGGCCLAVSPRGQEGAVLPGGPHRSAGQHQGAPLDPFIMDLEGQAQSPPRPVGLGSVAPTEWP